MIAVAAGILESGGKVLLAQRKAGSSLGLKWEFPGGKIERGEAPEAALERELLEELGVATRTGAIFDAALSGGEDGEFLILFYFSTILEEEEPRALDCRQVDWVNLEALLEYDLAPADRRVAEKLVVKGRRFWDGK